ncbi:MAG: hypothetical protein LC715_01315 [Gammaproteobacteria bacterium]|nr:hypothetical protein [Gammaproteobacteria bacterium]
MTKHDPMDQRARALYRAAAATLSPTMQGRLRAARRIAQADASAPARRVHALAVPIAGLTAAVMALAVGLRLQTPDRPDGQKLEDAAVTSPTQPAAAAPGRPAQSVPIRQVSNDETLLPMLDEDPDFYLWLGSDDALPATLEQRHDPS